MPRRFAHLVLSACVLWLSASDTHAAQVYYVADRTAGGIWALDDLNNDGDALDANEKRLWADGFINIGQMELDGTSVLAIEDGLTEGTNQVVRLTDLNNDGDALDTGERIVWADGLDDPRDISYGGNGNWYATELDNHQLLRFSDLNDDGDALDLNEQVIYADGILHATTVMPFAEGLLATAFLGDRIHYLVDHNQDGDALDLGENTIVVDGIDQPLGLLEDGNGGFYFASRSGDTVYHAQDRNGDGDMLDVLEVLSYADHVFGGVNGPWGMTDHHPGGFLLADYYDGQILRVNDANGDGDALDLGDVHVFADGFNLAVDVIAACGLAGDLNCDGFVGIADLNIVLSNWNQNVETGIWNQGDPSADGFVGIADLNTVLSNWNAGTPPGTNSTIPEPTTASLLTLGVLALSRRP